MKPLFKNDKQKGIAIAASVTSAIALASLYPRQAHQVGKFFMDAQTASIRSQIVAASNKPLKPRTDFDDKSDKFFEFFGKTVFPTIKP